MRKSEMDSLVQSDKVSGPPSDPWLIHAEHFPARGQLVDKLRFLVRYAVLAPSVRNTQPWRFHVADSRISLYVDLSRRQRFADRQQRDLYISVGCALENLLLAAAHFGFNPEIVYFPLCEEDELVAQLTFRAEHTPVARASPLFNAMTRRHTHHGRYDGRPCGPEALRKLTECCTEEGLRLLVTEDRRIKQAVDRLVVVADAVALDDRNYCAELAEAVGSGGFGGGPLTIRLGKLAIAYFGNAVAARNQGVLRTSPAFGLISAHKAGRKAQVVAGRLLERVYLTATTVGLCIQPLSVLLEFKEVSAAFAKLFRAGGVPLLPFRLGHAGDRARPTRRRPLEQVVHRDYAGIW